MAVKSKARHDLTLRSIKHEIGAGSMQPTGWTKPTSTWTNGLLTEDDITGIEILAQAYYDALDKPDETEDDEDNVDSGQNENTETLPE